MTDQTTPPINNDILRLLIREAVEREITSVVAPLRTDVQVVQGMSRQLDKDMGVLDDRVSALDDLVRGNPKQHLVGLAEQIDQQSKLISRLNEVITDAVEGVEKALRADIKQLKDNQEIAAKSREAMFNQWRGAKYALSVLALITGLASYETLARLFGVLLP